jgi:tellurite resistance protein TerC
MLAFDLFVLHRNAHELSVREAAVTSAIWVAHGPGFAVVVAVAWGGDAAANTSPAT